MDLTLANQQFFPLNKIMANKRSQIRPLFRGKFHLNLGLSEEYQLYIPYELHSDDGSEPPEEQKSESREMVIYFDHLHAIKTITK
jgi:hypothetical protein